MQSFVVNESSGCLDPSDWVKKYPLSRNHFNMNKFENPEEEDFKLVCEEIEAMVKKAPDLLRAPTQCI